ncbi:CsbD family protein [Corynebacterium alimapuense]|uniref:CsbD family protein n=1 Tax=Corynebacterium alimapuense TaxID=1576874 RepID=A0A3M8K4U2_9CORY|nr:CsbD family protein [Corynebacterium alimapuense]RNE48243.1 CsbD family protein [Corynebacterium alimapuense]
MGDFENKAEDLGGKAKEGYGEAVGDESVRDEGRADQTKADIKDKAAKAGESVKDGVNKILGGFQDDTKK